MSRRNAGYPVERTVHAPASPIAKRAALCGAHSKIGVLIGDPSVPTYKPHGIKCERCKAMLKKAGRPVATSNNQLRRCKCGHTWIQHGVQPDGSCVKGCVCLGFTARLNQNTITFTELKKLQMLCKTGGLYQMGKDRHRDVGIGMVNEGPADGSETLVTEDDGSVP